MKDSYQNYFESMPCFLTVQDREYRIINANKRFEQEFGDYEGRCCYQVYKHRPEKCEDCPVERTFRDGHPHKSEEWVRTKDGKAIAVVVYTTPIYNGGGEIDAVMEMSTDITEQKLLQGQLRESQEKYKLLFEEVPCYISIQDRDLRIVEANRLHREAFGTSYGDKCYKVYKHRDKACFPCIVKETFEDGEIRMHEEVVTSRHNEQMNVLVCTAPIRNAEGEIEKVVEMTADITQIRSLQDKLSAVGLLIGSISHSIKGLLSGLDGGIYLVNSGLKKNDRERIDQGWEMALRNLDRIRSMVMDILYYAKERQPEWEIISVRTLIEDVCTLMTEKARRLNIDFSYEISDGVGKFEADRLSARSLFVNLLENAIDACRVEKTRDSHFVRFEVNGNNADIHFKISDNGIGMSQETREKAFSLFFSSKGAGGTGLGLFIANKIAQTHGGMINIESEPGQGSTFIVKLPRECPVKEEAAGDLPGNSPIE
ncbi:MAG TPA: PAS domain-containing sensor histidine kinase [candidate division Zixibacteria bacterium]|nr:PAS domain-containing sensor histidine kinase [candidate division Zixibacteria bacterium]